MKINAVEPYDPELVEMVKTYIFLKFNDEAMVNAIANRTGNVMTRADLNKWKDIAKRERKEAKVEIEEYMRTMIELRMFEDVKDQYERSKDILNTNHMTFVRVAREGDVNKQVALTNVIIRQTQELRNIGTTMGSLVKIKEYIEKGFNEGPMDREGNGAGTTSISVQTKPKSSFDDAVAESISELDLKDNEVF